MNIALPVLLLIFGALTFWVLTESSLKWYLNLRKKLTFFAITSTLINGFF